MECRKSKIFLLIVLSLISAVGTFCQENTDDIVPSLKQKIEYNIRLLDSKKDAVVQNALTANKVEEPEQNSYLAFKHLDLAKVFIFDEHHIMIKEVAFEGGIFSSKLLNFHEVSLRRISDKKIYLSPLFSYKNKCYYFLGAKNSEREILLLFHLPKLGRKFALFDSDGNILVNTIGLSKSEIAENIKIINSEDELVKEEFIAKHRVEFFLPYAQYFLFD